MRTKSISFPNTQGELNTLFDKLQRAAITKLLNSGALAIHGSASALAKFANTIYFMIDGQVYSKTTLDCAALAGSVAHGAYNVFVFTVDAAGNLTTTIGTPGASLGAVVFPAITDGQVAIGFVIIHPTGTGSFVGGTANLDNDASTPNAVYVNTPFSFFPELATL